MAGSASAATIAAIAAASAGAVGTGYSIYAGQKASGQQAAALKTQNTAQQTATTNALSAERQSEIDQGAANQKTPDITQILRRAATYKGVGSTMLTGNGGVNPGGLNLGGATLLGS